MRLSDDLGFSTLSWVKPELDQSLARAREALEAYAEDASNETRIDACLAELHQVQGGLRMVELYGAAMIVDEMETVARAVKEQKIRQRDEAFAVLLGGMVQLPDYLERLQSGHKDIPIVLLPLLNDLRACRGEKLLSESVLFSPDLEAPLPEEASGAPSPIAEARLKAVAAQERFHYQRALLHWIRGQNPDGALADMISVLDRVRAIVVGEEARRLLWVGAAALDAVRVGGIEPSAAVKLLFGRVDREIRKLTQFGESAFRADPPRELVKNLLYYLAGATSSTPRTESVERTYGLSKLLPTERELEHAKGSLVGKNRALLDTVSAAIKEDLLRVKDALDLHLRSGAGHAELAAQVEVLDRIGDTLGMLGLGEPRRAVKAQRDELARIAAGEKAADERSLLDVAGALINVESSLDDNIERLGADAEEPESAYADSTASTIDLPAVEVRKIIDTLMKEAESNLASVREAFIAFIESPWDHHRLHEVPQLLNEVAGALAMLAVEGAPQLLDALRRFVEVELLKQQRVPDAEQLDLIADAFASIEYYIGAARQYRLDRTSILEKTRQSLKALGYWPPPESSKASLDVGISLAETLQPPPASVVEPGDQIGGELGELAGVALEISAPPEPAVTGVFNVTEPAASSQADGPAVPTADEFAASIDYDEIASIRLEAPAPADPAVTAVSEAAEPAVVPPAAGPGVPPADEPFVSIEFDEIPGVPLEASALAEPAVTAVPDAGEPAAAPPADVVPAGEPSFTLEATDAAVPEGEWVEVEEEVDEEIVPEIPGAFQAPASTEIDAEIREIFLEEVGEEIAQLVERLPNWVANRSDQEILKPIRRSFHTLKGSGRLVGAVAIGEFSWKIENMLNRVLDGTVPASDAVVALVEKAVATLPELRDALAEGRAPKADIADIMMVADELAQGREAWVGRRVVAKVRRVRRVWVPRAVEATPGAAIASGLVEPAQPSSLPSAAEAVAQVAIAQEALAEEAVAEEAMAEEAVAEEAVGEEAVAEEAASAHATIPALDPLLLEILRAEVGGHIQTLRAYVANAETGHARPVDDALVHAIHTMHGALSMSDVPGIAEVAGPLEGYAKRLRAQHLVPDPAGITAMRDAAGLLERTIHLLDYPGSPAPPLGDLPQRIAALRDALPELSPAFRVDMAEELAAELDATLDLSGLETQPIESSPGEVDLGAAAGSDAEIEAAPNVIADMAATEPEAADALGIFSDFEFDADHVGLNEEAAPEQAVGQEASVEPAAAEQAAFEQAAFEQAAFEQAAFERAAFEQAAFEQAAFEQAAFERAAFEQGAFEQGAFEQAAFEQGAFEQGAFEQGAFEQAAAQAAVAAPSSREAVPALDWPEEIEGEGPLQLADVDPYLLDLFVQEANEQLDVAEGAVARLRDDAADRSATADLQRELHTLKGNARAIGLSPIGDLTHAMETLVGAVVAGSVPLDPRVIEALERGFDRLHAMVNRVSQRQSIMHPAAAIALFESLAGVQEAQEPAPAIAETVPVEARPAAEPAKALEPEVPTTTILPATSRSLRDLDLVTAEAAAEEPSLRPPQELIRVRSDLLDALVNFAGEVAIYRARLEQQVGSYRANLVELDQTVTRLRGQLRQLEIETEAQILSRYQREAEAAGEMVFDPLELDRYSTLQQLSRALSESVNDLIALQTNLDDLTRQSETLLLQQSRVSTELQEGLMRTRMVPFDSIVPFLRRLLRQTGDELGKRAQLRIEGAQGEMDRNLLERMKAPLEHMLRNALAHGIESPEERVALGKPPEGEVKIAVGREATEVVIKVSDDGRGMNREAIRAKAIQRGLLRADAQLSDRDLFAFVLESGFSTAERVTQIAGRGVGMDVVASEIKQLGGSLAIDSVAGRGTTFTVRLPFTLAVTQAVLVRVGEHQFAVPMSAVQGIARIARGEYAKRMEGGYPVFSYAGEEFSMHDLAQLLSIPVSRREQEGQLPLLLVRAGDQRAAVRIDSVLGSREIVVKPVGPQINSVPGIFGATIMGDGSVVMILDFAPLLRRALALREQGAVERALEAALAEAVPGLAGTDESLEELVPFDTAPVPEPRRRPLVAVVDDSITMRRVTSRVLERNDIEVITAKDGLDAVERFQERVPDLILLDIEMPRMDGYELASYVRNDVRLRHIPIIMITSRTGEKHRQRAQDIGVNRYLGKPYQESELLKNVAELLNLTYELR